MPDYLIIGASAAGLACAERLRELEPCADITVISEDEKIYSRCMLHKGLSGERSDETLNFVDSDFFAKNRIEWMHGVCVKQVNEEQKTVRLSNDEQIPYGRLLIASGAASMIAPIHNLRDGKNVYGFRTMADMDQIRQALQDGAKRVAIIGAGLVGMDVAQTLCELGLEPTIIEREARIMPLQTDAFVAQAYQRLFEERGCRFCLGVAAEKAELDENGMVTALILQNGESVPCDVVVSAVSVRPRMEFLHNTSIQGMYMNYHIQTVLNRYLRKNNFHVDKGVTVNEYMQTSAPNIFAAGDVTGKTAIWPEAKAMGRCAASNMAGIPEAYPEPYPYQNTSNFWGMTMLSLGKVDVDEHSYRVLVHYDGKNYKKLVLKEGYLAGVLMLGDLQNAGIYRYLISNKISVERFTERQLFMLSFADFYGVDSRNGEFLYQQ